jgi:ABC-type Fe3+/spermidine/putrescine transport system ATPase subunit
MRDGAALRMHIAGEAVDVLPGERLGVTGRSGSGKTRLLETLVGLRSPGRDAFELAGQPFEAMPLFQVRALFSLAPQHARMLSGTVRDNLALADPAASEGADGLIDKVSPGRTPILDVAQRAALAAVVESGPLPAVHDVVRWRIVDLCQWAHLEFGVSLSEQTMSRVLRAMNYHKLTARPRHHAQAEGAIEDLKKFPRAPGRDRQGATRQDPRYRSLVRR